MMRNGDIRAERDKTVFIDRIADTIMSESISNGDSRQHNRLETHAVELPDLNRDREHARTEGAEDHLQSFAEGHRDSAATFKMLAEGALIPSCNFKSRSRFDKVDVNRIVSVVNNEREPETIKTEELSVYDQAYTHVRGSDNGGVFLYVAANPTRQKLPLDTDYAEIKAAMSVMRDLKVVRVDNATAFDLLLNMVRHRPRMVHIDAHGRSDGAIVLHNRYGSRPRRDFLLPEEMDAVWHELSGHLRFIYFDACHSEEFAKHVYDRSRADSAGHNLCLSIGYKGEIKAGVARAFAKAFYEAVGHDKPFKQCYANARDRARNWCANRPELDAKRYWDVPQLFI